MMPSFRPGEYYRSKDLHEAARLLSGFGGKARIISGGTDILVEKPPEVECLVDISNLELVYIKKSRNGIIIGAATTLDLLESSPILSSAPYNVVSEAAGMIATPTVRNMATIGGNICNASPAADLPLALMVLDSTVKIVGLNGSRVVPVGDFFKDVKKTILDKDELLSEVHIPFSSKNSVASFLKLRHHQTSVDIAVVNVAARLTCSDEICEDASIALGAVAKTPIYAKQAERLLVGKRIDGELIRKAAEAAAEESGPIDDIRASASYRRRMVSVLVRRALEVAFRGVKHG